MKQSQKGFVGLYLTILVLMLMLGIIVSIGFGVVIQQKIIRNITQSAQAYFAAESGVEDALIRLVNGQNVCDPPGSPPCSNTLQVAGASATTTVSGVSAGARTITAEGDYLNRFRTAQVVYELSSSAPGFFYGAHIGEGGLVMDNDSKVNGNVFSNKNITGFSDSIIDGDAIAVDTISSPDPTVSGTKTTGASPIPLPISDATILDWKDAAAVTTISGNYIRASGTHYLGPAKITGELEIESTAQLVVTGTLWVQGKITIQNDAQVRLDAGYGSTSGVILSDSLITLQDDSVSSGSGSAGSYLMYLSTSSANPALIIQNDAQVDILYTNNGWILVQDDAHMREVTGYGIHLKNDASITYEIGLANAAFTSGPNAGWTVTSWKEIE